MSDLDTARKIAQLENDTSEVYGLLTSIQRSQRLHTQQLEGIESGFKGFRGLETRLGSLETRFEGVEGTLAEILHILRSE